MTKRQRRENKSARMTNSANTKRRIIRETIIEDVRSKKEQPISIEIVSADAVQTREVRSQRMVKEAQAVATDSVSSISAIEFRFNVRF